jgi:hypothetical protein
MATETLPKRKNTNNSLYRIFSTTKMFTAAVILKLEEEGSYPSMINFQNIIRLIQKETASPLPTYFHIHPESPAKKIRVIPLMKGPLYNIFQQNR